MAETRIFLRYRVLCVVLSLTVMINMQAHACTAEYGDSCDGQAPITTNDGQMDVHIPVCSSSELPNALKNWDSILQKVDRRPLAICLDYDGTLTPHVPDPDKAVISEEMKLALKRLSNVYRVSIITGRPLSKIREFLKGFDNVYFGASHGLHIAFDSSENDRIVPAKEDVTCLQNAYKYLHKSIGAIEGCIIEDNTLTVAVHYRNVQSEDNRKRIKDAVDRVLSDYQTHINMIAGAMVWELRPKIEWDKGRALEYILKHKFEDPSTIALYIGDDTTDEDAFQVVRRRDGISVLVAGKPKESAAEYVVSSTDDVLEILNRLSDNVLIPTNSPADN